MAGALVLLTAAPASGHGPCECVQPALAFPGAQVRIEGPAYRIVFNPGPPQIEDTLTPRYLVGAYEPEVPTRTVLSRPQRQAERPAHFRAPQVRPGVYLVQIFDGLEGGQHVTWGYLHIAGERPPTAERSRPARVPEETEADDSGFAWGAAGLGAAAAAVLAGIAAIALRRRAP